MRADADVSGMWRYHVHIRSHAQNCLTFIAIPLLFLAWIPNAWCSQLPRENNDSTDQSVETDSICGQRAICLALAMLGKPTSLDQILAKLGSEPLSIRQVIEYFSDRGLSITACKSGGYQELSQIANGDSPTIGIALFGADALQDGHYFVLYRGATQKIVAIEPTSESVRTVASEAEFANEYILLLVSSDSFIARALKSTLWAVVLIFGIATVVAIKRSKVELSLWDIGSTVIVAVALWLTCDLWEYRSSIFHNLSSAYRIDSKIANVAANSEIHMIKLDKELGRVAINVPVHFSFEIQNSWKFDAQFQSFAASCTCVTLDCPNQSIAPGIAYKGNGVIRLANPGNFTQRIYCERKIGSTITPVQINIKGTADEGVWLKQHDFFVGPVVLPPSGVFEKRFAIPAMFGNQPIRCQGVSVAENSDFISAELDDEDNLELWSTIKVSLKGNVPSRYDASVLCKFDAGDKTYTLPLRIQFSVQTSPHFTPNTIVLSRQSDAIGWLRIPSEFNGLPMQLVAEENSPIQLQAEFSIADDLMEYKTLGISLFEVKIRAIAHGNHLDSVERVNARIVDSTGKEVAKIQVIAY